MQRIFALHPPTGALLQHLFYDIERERLTAPFSQVLGHAEVELSDWGSLRLPDDFERPEMDVGWHEMDCLSHGAGVILYGGRRFPMEPGQVYFFPAGATNGCREHRGVRKAYCHFRLVSRGIDLLHGAKPWSLPITKAEIRNTARVFGSRNILSIKSVLHHFLSRCQDRVEALVKPRMALREKYAGFFQAMERGETLPSLAAKAGKSSKAFARSFQAAFGITPKKYLLNAQVDQISRELGQKGKTLAEIADDLGFKDPFYLSRFFKKQTGMSPSEFREGFIRQI